MTPTNVHLQSSTATLPQIPVSFFDARNACLPAKQAKMSVNPGSGEATTVSSEKFCSEQAMKDNLSMVRFLARQIHARLPQHVELEELVAAGTLGLVDAATRFDGHKQVQFKSYAQYRIRGAIMDALRSTDWSPRTLRRQGRLVEQAMQRLGAGGKLSATEEEIAEEMGLTLNTYQNLLTQLKGLQVGSLQIESGEAEEQEIQYIAGPASNDPLFQCLKGEMCGLLKEALDCLPEKERLVLTLYYHEELTMREIAQVLHVVESRVSQMHASAVLRMRAALSARRAGSEPTGAARIKGAAAKRLVRKPRQTGNARKGN